MERACKDAWHELYTEEINKATRHLVRTSDNGIGDWCITLENRFKDSPKRALAALKTCCYTVQDAAKGRDPKEYVQRIVVHGKNAGTATTETTQILTAYQHLQAELRINVPAPNDKTTIEEFLITLRDRKNVWFDLYGNRFGRDSQYRNNARQSEYYSSKSLDHVTEGKAPIACKNSPLPTSTTVSGDSTALKQLEVILNQDRASPSLGAAGHWHEVLSPF